MNVKFNYRTLIDNEPATDELKTKLGEFKEIIDNPKFGFFHLTDDQKILESAKNMYEKYKGKKNFVQVGIGGSALGPQMLISALKKTDVHFEFLDNTDSDYLSDCLSRIDLKDSLFYVVSKSGGTAETIACYSIIRNLLKEQGVAEADFGKYFVFCTDPSNGQLREHVTKHNYDSLEVPSNIGGRFSVLTHVGLFPALFAGIDIDKLFSGANKIKENLLDENTSKNDLLLTVSKLFHLYNNVTPSVNETVLMPYSSKLKDLSYWFVQLWAESLGKFNADGNGSVGFTPVPAYGATDQHSQVQLFMEGPINKCLFILHIENKETNFKLDSGLDLDSAKKLDAYDMNQLLEAEFNGTLKALEENKRHVIQINIDRLEEENIGALILYFESITALMGSYLKIDPFNQPGVEKGKVYTYEYLNSL